jgi:hypothetical protein
MDDKGGKLMIKDLEQIETDKANDKVKKRKRADVEGYGLG